MPGILRTPGRVPGDCKSAHSERRVVAPTGCRVRGPRFFAAALLLAGCGPPHWLVPPPTPSEIPALEARVAGGGADVATMVRLGAARREAGMLDGARDVLEQARVAAPANSGAVLYLGLTYEDLGLFARARSLYTGFLDGARSDRVREALRGRLALLQRQEILAAVRSALAREAKLADAPPEPGTIAVFPFDFIGQDPQYRPLGRAMAEMLVTDLSQIQRLTVLERTRVQLLLDELDLARSGAIDPATAARSGRLLGAARVIQGSIDQTGPTLRLQVAVVPSTDPGAPAQEPILAGVNAAPPPDRQLDRVSTLAETDRLDRLFELETRVAFGILAELQVELTAAERERVRQRPTANLQAILAYGLGLEAQDAGDFQAAATHFARASALDPGFEAASDRAASAAAAARTSTGDIARIAALEVMPPARRAEAATLLVPDFVQRDPAAELLGTEGFGRPTVLEVIIRRPGSDPK